MNAGDPRDRAIEAWLSQRTQPVRATAECLDAETLAAYVDGGLGGPTREAAETHLASCAYCQTVMATVVASAEEVTQAPVEGARWKLNLRWLMPLAGAAAAVVLWMVVPASGPATQQARSDDPAGYLARESKADAPSSMPASPAVEQVAPEPAGVLAEQDARQRAPAATAAGTSANEGPGRRAEADLLAKAEDRSSTAGATSAPSTSAALEARAAEADQRPVPPPPAPVAAAPPAQAFGSANRTAAPSAAEELRSIDAAVRWRFAGPGFVERSTDGGTSWERFDTGVRTQLRAGVCPSASTCWVVGDAGVVLRTLDAQTWQPATSPTIEDLVAVESTSAEAAIVLAASGQRYSTSDGGITWTRVPL